nr:hypothetical protein [Mucilaginibacter sp. SP1R1]
MSGTPVNKGCRQVKQHDYTMALCQPGKRGKTSAHESSAIFSALSD